MAANGQGGLDGDRVFLGMESRLDASGLGPGLVALARNTRMRAGKLETRPGIAKMKWVGRRAAPFPLQFPIDFDQRMPFVQVFGAGRWNDPNEVEWVMIAASVRSDQGAKIWAARAGSAMREVTLPAGEMITGDVSFTQAFSKLFLFRGADAAPLVLETLDDGFRTLSLTADDTAAGLAVIPNAVMGLWIQNRMVIPHGRDLVDVSDALDPEHVFAATSRFRINQGSSDALTGIFKFNDTTLVAAKEESIYVLSGLTPDADGRFSGATLDSVTTSWGFIARRSVCHCGGDLWGLTQMGMMGVQQTEQNKLQGVSMPLSAPMQAVMDRINWRFAAGAAAAYWDSKYYLAVPLDDAEALGNEMMWSTAAYAAGTLTVHGLEPGRKYRLLFGANDGGANAGTAGTFDAADQAVADFVATQESVTLTKASAAGATADCTVSVKELHSGVNNAVLVYDFIRKQWDGYDDGPAVLVKEFVKLTYQGQERLFFVSADGFLSLYEEGFTDDVWHWSAWPEPIDIGMVLDRGVVAEGIETEWITRGFGLRALQNDGLGKADMGESRAKNVLLALRTWNPTYAIYARAEGVSEEETMVAARTRSRTRYQQWGRADWVATNANDDFLTPFREDYSVALTAQGIQLRSGIKLGLHQDCLERVRAHGRAQAMQVRIVSTQGRIELLRAEVETGGGRKRMGSLY